MTMEREKNIWLHEINHIHIKITGYLHTKIKQSITTNGKMLRVRVMRSFSNRLNDVTGNYFISSKPKYLYSSGLGF